MQRHLKQRNLFPCLFVLSSPLSPPLTPLFFNQRKPSIFSPSSLLSHSDLTLLCLSIYDSSLSLPLFCHTLSPKTMAASSLFLHRSLPLPNSDSSLSNMNTDCRCRKIYLSHQSTHISPTPQLPPQQQMTFVTVTGNSLSPTDSCSY
jgi:hypothetical protein